MAEKSDSVYTARHLRLGNIATAAKVFAWIALIMYLFLGGFNLWVGFRDIPSAEIFSETGLYMILASTQDLQSLITGIVYWLVLMGGSMGLNMIIETDVNYRIQAQEEEHE